MTDFAFKVYSSGEGPKPEQQYIPSRVMSEHKGPHDQSYREAKSSQRRLNRKGHSTFIAGEEIK